MCGAPLRAAEPAVKERPQGDGPPRRRHGLVRDHPTDGALVQIDQSGDSSKRQRSTVTRAVAHVVILNADQDAGHPVDRLGPLPKGPDQPGRLLPLAGE